MKYYILLFYISYQKKKIIYGPPKDKFLAPPLLAGNENESEIGNSATRRCDRHGATRGSWVRGFVVRTSWVRCSWVRRSWVHGFAVLRFAVHGFAILRLTISSVVRRSQLSGFAISLSLCLRESFLSLFLSLRVSGNDLKVKFG